MDRPQEDQGQQSITMVIEEDAELGTFLLEVLSTERGSHVLLPTDGVHVLASEKALAPDLFLLDDHLPGITGRERVERFQPTEMLDAIPSVLMSAKPLKQELKQCDLTFLQKPFGLDHLLRRLHASLGSHDRDR